MEKIWGVGINIAGVGEGSSQGDAAEKSWLAGTYQT